MNSKDTLDNGANICQRRLLKKYEFDIPKELENVRYKIIKDGYLQIFENGRVFFINKRGEKVEARHIKNNGYLSIAVLIGDTQKVFYVHRLLAEAFVPNPEKKDKVVLLDNNRENISLDNIAWMTHGELIKYNYKKKINDPYKRKITVKCKKCGRKTNAKSGYCRSCEKKRRQEQKRKKRKDSVKHLVNHIETLTARQQVIVLLRYEGYSVNEIAEKVGVTTQAIQKTLKRAENRVKNISSD